MIQPKRVGGWLGLLALVALACGEVQGGGKGQKLPEAKTPEIALKNLLTALQAADFELLIGQLASPTREMMQLGMSIEGDRAALKKALDEKFGKELKPNPFEGPGMAESMKKVKNLQILAKQVGTDKNVLTMTVWTTEERDTGTRVKEDIWFAVKEGNVWKIVLPSGGSGKSEKVTKKGPDGKEVEVEVRPSRMDRNDEQSALEIAWFKTIAPKLKANSANTLKSVKAGAFKTRSEAMQAHMEGEGRIFQDHPLPGVGTKKEDKKEKK